MKTHLVTLQRGPFLMPIWLTGFMAFFGFCFFVFAIWIWATASSTTLVVTRHAEKDLTQGAADPPLTAAGRERAERLARMFGDARDPGHLDAIYVSPALRSRQTAEPLASRLGLQEVVLPADDPKGLAHRALREHRGGRVLIVGHSDTVPVIVAELSGAKFPEIGDDEYGTLYVVTVPRFGRANFVRMSY